MLDSGVKADVVSYNAAIEGAGRRVVRAPRGPRDCGLISVAASLCLRVQLYIVFECYNCMLCLSVTVVRSSGPHLAVMFGAGRI